MKLSTKGRYALRAVVEMAELEKTTKGPVSLKKIAERQKISMKYLEALFAGLKNAGIIKSIQGARGGYYLARSPRTIKAKDVIDAIEGKVSVVECCVEHPDCPRIRSCKTVKLWRKINKDVNKTLSTTSLHDLMS